MMTDTEITIKEMQKQARRQGKEKGTSESELRRGLKDIKKVIGEGELRLAKKLLAKGMNIEKVVKLTELPKKEIKKLMPQ